MSRASIKNVKYLGETKGKAPQTEATIKYADTVETVVNKEPIVRYRDAKSGSFIAAEVALEQDPSTWIADTEFNKPEFLEEVYWALDNYRENDIISIDNVRKVFESFGLKFKWS
jgi:hypothetical protein